MKGKQDTGASNYNTTEGHIRLGNGLLHEVRMAVSWAARHRILVAVVSVTLGLGIGVNATIFAMIHALLLRSLPYRGASEVVLINRLPLGPFLASSAAFHDWKENASFLQDAALFAEGEANLFGSSDPVHIRVANVSASLFTILGTTPARGRLFHAEEERPGQDRVVILSHNVWQRHFGADMRVLGSQVRMNGKEYEVIGVLPSNFDFPERTDAWLPSAHDPVELRSFGSVARFVISRLRKGVSVAQANDAVVEWMESPASGIGSLPPKHLPYWRLPFVRSLRDQLVGTLRTPILMIWGAALVVLFIGCINAAHLLLASFATRRHDFGVRRALGMSTAQLVRQLLLEQLVLGFAAGFVGLLLARWLTSYLQVLLPATWPQSASVNFDAQVFVFTLALSLFVGLLIAIQPCWQMSKDTNSLAAGFTAGRRVGESRSHRKSHWILNVTQTALVTVLLITAGLFIKTLVNLQQVDWGYDAQKLLCLSVSRPETTLGSGPEGARQYYSQVAQALAQVPGVERVTGVDFLPIRSTTVQITEVRAIGGRSVQDVVEASPRIVMPGYFQTLGIQLLDGRDFDQTSYANSESLAVVSKGLAMALWGTQHAAGKYVTLDSGSPLRVVGVVGDIRFFGPRSSPTPEIYQVYSQRIPRSFSFVVRASLDPMRIALDARNALKNVSQVQPIDEVATMEQYVDRSMQIPRSLATLLNVLAAVGLALAVIGTYGLVWFTIRRSWRTLAVCLAIGATPRTLMARSVVNSMKMIIVGSAIGVVLAIGGGRLIESQLYGLKATDPAVFVMAIGTLLSIAAVTAVLASHRITRIDPAAILRESDV